MNGGSSGQVLGAIPSGLRGPLLDSFSAIVRNYREGRWEPSELNGGKLCEVVYCVLRGHIDGAFPARPSKPANMVDACRGLEKSTNEIRPVRIQIPRVLIALYEIRNNRGVGHVGGDVDPNHMDAVAVLYMAKWIMAELVRIFHKVDTEMAAATVDALVERELSVIWKVNGRKRVLNPSLSHKNRSLLLLYGESLPVSDSELALWVEHPRLADFRKDVLQPLHRQKLVEYDRQTSSVQISPLGSRHVETNIPLDVEDSGRGSQ